MGLSVYRLFQMCFHQLKPTARAMHLNQGRIDISKNFYGKSMKSWIALFTFLSLACNSDEAKSQGISEIICDNHARVMEMVISWREKSIPIQYARETFDHEDNLELRYWLRNIVKQTYKDPDAGAAFTESGAFAAKCTEIHRGF